MSAAPIKVLVIDDEPPIRKLLRMGLTTQGYEILEASNGKTALEATSFSSTAGLLQVRPPCLVARADETGADCGRNAI
ncbi:DNA-binding response OmpR family regulator [Bradyrhizobium sp. USDA 3051]